MTNLHRARKHHLSLGYATACVVILVTIWLTRLIAIEQFPPFIDEIVHVYGSEEGYTISPLANASLGRQGTIWWLMLFEAHRGTPIWIARVATVLALMPGVAALMGTARAAAGGWAAVFAGLLFLFSNYHMFFGRLALADPIAGSGVLIAISLAARLAKRQNGLDAVMCGLVLCAAVIAKINVLPFLGIPLAAAVTLKPPGEFNWRRQLWWTGIALGSALLPLGLFVVGLWLFGYDIVTNSVSYALTNRGTDTLSSLVDFDRIVFNIRLMYSVITGYMGTAGFIVMLLASSVLLLRRQFYLLLCLVAPLMTLWLSLIQESRFLVVPAALLYACAAVGIADLIAKRGRWWQTGVITVIVGWGIFQWLPFAWSGAQSPTELPLPYADRNQYIYSDAAGTGYLEAREFLRRYPVREVIGLITNCQGFRYLSLDVFQVDCPKLNPNGSNITELETLINQKRGDDIFVLLQDIPYVPTSVPGRLLTVINRPGGGPTISIYQLSQAD